ncbi:MAG TPA: porin [Thermoanaerobaculia bacterium]|nr:porin [Thermoanaerobaculia bacterium]
MKQQHLALAVLAAALTAVPARAGVTVFEEGGRTLEIGGTIQVQYHLTDPAAGGSDDELFFRRLRPYVAGRLDEDWYGKVEVDFGGSSGGNELAVKDAYVRYSGFEGLQVTLGNQKPPFSREFLTSSKEQQLVERTFVGDHNYGVPDRMLGVVVGGDALERRITYAGSFGSASVDPDARRLDFDSPATRDDDFNEGWLAAGRVDWHPLGYLKPSQGDFTGEPRFTLGAALFTWSNDGDNDTRTEDGRATDPARPDVDAATGAELSAALRGRGLSIDVQAQRIEGDTVDPRFSGGLYRGGATTLDQLAVEGGYMIVADRLEAVAAWEWQDADGYRDPWTRTSLGLDLYLDEHALKGQLTYRLGENLDGVPGRDADELFLQLQYVF